MYQLLVGPWTLLAIRAVAAPLVVQEYDLLIQNGRLLGDRATYSEPHQLA